MDESSVSAADESCRFLGFPMTRCPDDPMTRFEILFDHAEPSALVDPVYDRYGNLGFRGPPPDRPWIFSNFVQSLDGIVSFKGRHPLGSDISQSEEDRWLMDLLRAHADAVLLGINTLVEETRVVGGRGPVYRIEDPTVRELRRKLGRRKETNIFVTASFTVEMEAYRVFDGDLVETFIITTKAGLDRRRDKLPQSGTKVIVAGEGDHVDLPKAMQILRADFGIEYLLCEGGPTLYGYMSHAGLIDEKFITVSPVEVGLLVPPEEKTGVADRSCPLSVRPTTFMAPGFTKETAPWWRWLSCRRVGDHQFSRYRRIR